MDPVTALTIFALAYPALVGALQWIVEHTPSEFDDDLLASVLRFNLGLYAQRLRNLMTRPSGGLDSECRDVDWGATRASRRRPG